LIREQSLDKLDAKEYPLALKAIPAGLTNFSYDVGEELGDIYEDNDHAPLAEVCFSYVSIGTIFPLE
jgi:F-box and WD-40 domain protein CDC4